MNLKDILEKKLKVGGKLTVRNYRPVAPKKKAIGKTKKKK